MVGSYVEIVSCESHPHLLSTEGFFIGETSQPWRLATLPRKVKVEKDKPKSMHMSKSKSKSKKRICKVLTVPKGDGTMFALVLNPAFGCRAGPARLNDGSTKPPSE
jgi:hypothetical protein